MFLSPIGFLGGNDFFVDKYMPNPAAVYGMKKLVSNYNGPLLRIRRSSDNVELDIGFTSTNSLNTDLIANFVGTQTPIIRGWYDQSGNSLHAIQSINSLQPKLYASGGNYFIYTDAVGQILRMPSSARSILSNKSEVHIFHKFNNVQSNNTNGATTFFFVDEPSPGTSHLFLSNITFESGTFTLASRAKTISQESPTSLVSIVTSFPVKRYDRIKYSAGTFASFINDSPALIGAITNALSSASPSRSDPGIIFKFASGGGTPGINTLVLYNIAIPDANSTNIFNRSI